MYILKREENKIKVKYLIKIYLWDRRWISSIKDLG